MSLKHQVPATVRHVEQGIRQSLLSAYRGPTQLARCYGLVKSASLFIIMPSLFRSQI